MHSVSRFIRVIAAARRRYSKSLLSRFSAHNRTLTARNMLRPCVSLSVCLFVRLSQAVNTQTTLCHRSYLLYSFMKPKILKKWIHSSVGAKYSWGKV